MNNSKNQQLNKYIWITIYGIWNSAISFSPLDHFRKNDELEDKFMWYKLNITWTPNLFEKKHAFYIEWDELLNALLVLKNLKSEMISKRNAKTSNTNKSITIKKYQDEIYCKIDVQNSDKLSFKITWLNRIILIRMLEDLILKDMKYTSWITFTKVDLHEYIKELYIDSINLKSEDTNENVKQNTNEKIEEEKKEIKNDKLYNISFVNTYNGKSFTNKTNVSKDLYEQISKFNTQSKDNNYLNEMINMIKNECWDKAKFINIKNIPTIKIL